RTRGPCQLMPHGGIAVDVGANVRFFAYALADIADRVFAFEPNPDYAFFARWMLRGRAEVREIALSAISGHGTLYVPLSDKECFSTSPAACSEGTPSFATLRPMTLRCAPSTNSAWRACGS